MTDINLSEGKAPKEPNGNGRVRLLKQRTLATIAILALVGVVSISGATWFMDTEAPQSVLRAQAFLETMLGTIIGYLTGSLQPDRKPEGE